MSINNISKSISSRYVVKVYIQDDNYVWVDFTDRLPHGGRDSLLNIGDIKYTVEKKYGVLQKTTQSIEFDNSDGFFSKPFPSTLNSSIDEQAAYFKTSKNGNLSVLGQKKLKISVGIFDTDTIRLVGSDYSSEFTPFFEYPLAVFIIKSLDFDVYKKVVTLSLVSLEEPLQNISAEKVKDGLSWYQNKPVAFLVKKLLETYYMESGGELPTSYNIDRAFDIPTADGSLALSHFGRPPEWDGTTWRNDGLHCRALCWGTVGTGGDARTGLWLGCDNELWYLDTSTDTYSMVDKTTIGSGLYIKKLFIVGTTLYVFAWIDEVWGSASVGMSLYKYNGSGSLVFTASISDFRSCINNYRHYSITTTNPYGDRLSLGCYPDSYGGENVAIPFPQRVRFSTGYSIPSVFGNYNASIWYGFYYANDIDLNENHDISAAKYTSCNYCCVFDAIGVPGTLSVTAINSYNIPYQLLFNTYAAYDRFYFSSYSTTTGLFYLKYIDIINTIAVFQLPPDYQPLCLFQRSESATNIYISCINYINVGTGDSCRSRNFILKFNQSSSTFSSWDFCNGVASGEDAYWTLIEMVSFPVAGAGIGVAYNRMTKMYKLLYFSNCESSLVVLYSATTLKDGIYQYTKLYYDPITTFIFFGEVGTGNIYSVSSVGVLTLYSEGDSAVEGDYQILSNLVSDTTNGTVNAPIIYGISSPYYAPETQESAVSGKYYLFRLANKITDRIELADFSNISIWDAIKLLAETVKGIASFDSGGNFFFKSRLTESGNADFKIGCYETYPSTILSPIARDILSMEVSTGENEIFNYCAIIPSKVVYSAPDGEAITLVTRSENEYGEGISEVPFVPYDIDQRDNLTKTVRAICTASGSTTDGMSRFRYSITVESISVYLAVSCVASATGIYLSSVFGGDSIDSGIHVGDFLQVLNESTGAYIIKSIIAVNSDNNSISFDSAIGIDLIKGTELQILKGFRNSVNSIKFQWSDEGVTYTNSAMSVGASTVSLAYLDGVSVGTVIKFAYGTAISEEFRITAVNKVTKYINFIPITTTAIPSGAKVLAWYSPKSGAGYQEIGGSKVFLNFRDIQIDDPSNPPVAEKDYTSKFKIGDRITIDCPGLTVETDDKSKQIALNVTSEKIYGRKEYNKEDNIFFSRRLAKQLCKDIVASYSYPSYLINLTCPFIPSISLLNSSYAPAKIDIFSPDAFPFSAGAIQQCYIRSIEHNLKNLTTFLVLKAINPY